MNNLKLLPATVDHYGRIVIIALSLLTSTNLFSQPTGFIDELVDDSWTLPIGLTFDNNDRMYVWEKAGKVYIVENGVKLPTPLLDISEEVRNYKDYGFLSFALDPDFNSNGYVYCLYVVDRHHLLYYGTPSYNPNTDDNFGATIGRLTRFTADTNDNYNSIIPGSRWEMIGATIDTGLPLLNTTHGPGTVLFGTDGTLLVSCGDGASPGGEDIGGDLHGSYGTQALADGIISPKEDVGAYRSQLLDCLGGKILRIDKNTGLGLSNNPFYEASDPGSAQSRVWALGIRQAHKMTIRPGTGSINPANGDPGVIYFGDVGWYTWEELDVVTGPGMNFGWPIYEGLELSNQYISFPAKNLDAPNPLYNGTSCTVDYFSFHDLIIQETLEPNPSFPNPCNPGQEIPSGIQTYMHSRPALDWKHYVPLARTGIFNGNDAAIINVGAPGSPVSGPLFGGHCSIGGAWYTGTSFPAQYQNTYFQADYSGQEGEWIKNFSFTSADKPTAVADFMDVSRVTNIVMGPDDALYYIRHLQDEIRKISYNPGGNNSPTAVASLDQNYGPTPLLVQFTGDQSSDPEGPVTYEWDFGDGSPVSNLANPSHSFTATGGQPTSYTVTLTVTDNQSATDQTTLLVSVNNTPPQVSITSPTNGQLYPINSGNVILNLTANVSDAEHSAGELTYAWITRLYHNEHYHEDPPDNNPVTTTIISPLGCGSETYYYGVRLIVTDAIGLSTLDSVLIFPDCGPSNLPNPLAHWPMDGSGQDIQNGNDGIPTNGATFSTDSQIGIQSLSLDGTNDYLALVGSGSVGFMHDSFSNRTVAMWLKPSSTSGARDLFDEGGSGKGFALRLNNGNLEAAVRNGGSGTQITLSTPYPSDGQWHHAGAVFSSGTFQLYIDGLLADTQTTGYSSVGNHDDPGGIGISNNVDAFGSGNGNYYQGLIDDARLYDLALDGNQMLTLATEGGTSGPPPTITITSPQEGSTVSGNNIVLNYTLSGDLTVVNRLFLTLDSDPAIEITNLSGGYTFNNVGQGSHSIKAELANGQTILTNPEATDIVNFSTTSSSLPNPLAHWPMDGSGQDIQNGNDGIPTNGATFSTDSQIGIQSLSLDGTNDYLALVGSGSAGFMHDAFSTHTVTMWIKPTSTSGIRDVFDEGGSGKGFALRLNNGNLEAAVRNGGSGTQIVVSTPYPSDGQWHHIGAVFNSGTFQLYLDGLLADTQTTGYSSVGNHDDPGGIGISNNVDAFGSGNGNYYQGLIDDARLYDVALDGNQMLTLATEGGTSGPPPTVTITSPQEGSTVSGNNIVVNYTLSGDLTVVDHIFLTLDSNPAAEIHDLSGTYTFNNVSQGNHSIKAELANGHTILTNPEATDIVNFSTTSSSLPNPLAHWPMDGTGQDIQNGNDGIPTNGAGFSTDSQVGSQSMSLDGVDDYLFLVGFGSGFMHDAFNGRAITMWLKPSSTSGSRNLYDEGGTGKGFALRLNNGNLEAAIRNSGSGTQIVVSTPYPSDGQWHHAGAVFNSGTFDLFLDGILSATQTTGYGTIGNHDDPGGIGVSNNVDAFGSGNGNYYQGLIDDARLYDVALDANQILELYYNTAGGLPAQAFPSNNFEQIPNDGIQTIANRIVVYPNPAKDQFNVTLELVNKEMLRFKLIDLLGKSYNLGSHEVEQGKSKLNFDRSELNLAPGIYYLEVQSQNITSRSKIYLQ